MINIDDISPLFHRYTRLNMVDNNTLHNLVPLLDHINNVNYYRQYAVIPAHIWFVEFINKFINHIKYISPDPFIYLPNYDLNVTEGMFDSVEDFESIIPIGTDLVLHKVYKVVDLKNPTAGYKYIFWYAFLTDKMKVRDSKVDKILE